MVLSGGAAGGYIVVNLVVRNVPIITDQLSSVVFYFYVQIMKHSIYALIASGFRYLLFFFFF